jgi:hypothetical protein
MTSIRSFVLGTTALAAALVGINGVSYAATGHNLVLGHTNKANHATTLKRVGSGVALDLRTKNTSAPFAVNSSKVVNHLNAYLLNGHTAASLQTNAIQYSIPTVQASNGVAFAFADLPKGVYQVSYNLAATMTTKASRLRCELDLSDNTVAMLGIGDTDGNLSVLNNSGVLDLRAATAYIQCTSASGNFQITSSAPTSVVTMVRIDGLTHKAAYFAV